MTDIIVDDTQNIHNLKNASKDLKFYKIIIINKVSDGLN